MICIGRIEEAGPIHPWDFSPAYTEELGENIRRRFFIFEELADPVCLPDWKLSAIKIERECSLNTSAAKRQINLDPGYLSGSQVILASTKRYQNRVYLRDVNDCPRNRVRYSKKYPTYWD